MCSILEKAVSDLGDNAKNAEIAFFGGSFTAIDRDYMISLLDATKSYIDQFMGIRISTRPDCINTEILDILKFYKVTSIELGAQSMDEEVLLANKRGHSAGDIVKASELIKQYGFSLGLQMMTGLYKSDFNKDIYTAEKFIQLKPDTVRIYPTIVMKDTDLADYYNNGSFVPYTLEESVSLCAKLILMFENENIKIIRLGLHYSDSLINNSLGNNYHPAFKELCENKIFLDKLILAAETTENKNLTVCVNQKSLSKLLGQKKSNITQLNKYGYNIKTEIDNSLGKYDLYIK